MLSILLYGVGGVVGLVLLVAVVGMLLPAEHVATRSATVARPPDEVWRALTDRARQPEWRRGLEQVEPLPDQAGKPAFREHSRHGVIAFAVEEETPPDEDRAGRLVTRIADDSLPFGGRWIHQVSADGADRTRVTITEEGVVKNPLFRFMARFVFGHTATLDAFLRDLAAHLGSGH